MNRQSNGRVSMSAIVPWIAVALAVAIPYFSGQFTQRDRVTVLESDMRHVVEDVARIDRTLDRRAHDVADLLHQPGDEREADRLITLFNDPDPTRITRDELDRLAGIMKTLGDDKEHSTDGTRSLAKELLRLIEKRLEDKQPR